MNELTVVTPPDGDALSLDAAKDFLRIGHDGENALVSDLIAAATARLEAALSISLVMRGYEAVVSAWPRGMTRDGLRLKRGPVAAIDAVEIIAPDGERTLVTERFAQREDAVCLKPFMALPFIMPGGGVSVRYLAGFGPSQAVPADLVQALKDMVAAGYARTEMAVPSSILARKRVTL